MYINQTTRYRCWRCRRDKTFRKLVANPLLMYWIIFTFNNVYLLLFNLGKHNYNHQVLLRKRGLTFLHMSFYALEETLTRRQMMYVTMIRNLLASGSPRVHSVRYQTVSRISRHRTSGDVCGFLQRRSARGRSARWQTIISQRRRILFTTCR